MNPTRRIAALSLTAMIVVGLPLGARAQTDRVEQTVGSARVQVDRSTEIDLLRRRAQLAIDARLQRIARLESQIGSSVHLTADHAATLSQQLGDAKAGLNALGAQIASATTLEELRTLIPKIAEDYRIYVLVTPKVHIAIGADVMNDLTGRFDTVAGKVADAISRAEAAGYDVGDAQAALDRMNAEVSSAQAIALRVPGQVIPLTPADWPDPAQGTLRSTYADLQDGAQSLRAARQAAVEAVTALKEAVGTDG